jgi:hypothetical protein
MCLPSVGGYNGNASTTTTNAILTNTPFLNLLPKQFPLNSIDLATINQASLSNDALYSQLTPNDTLSSMVDNFVNSCSASSPSSMWQNPSNSYVNTMNYSDLLELPQLQQQQQTESNFADLSRPSPLLSYPTDIPASSPLSSYDPTNTPSYNDCILPTSHSHSLSSSNSSSASANTVPTFFPETLTLTSQKGIGANGTELKTKKKRIRVRKDKEKHNLSEVRRRAELRSRFVTLQEAVGCEQKDRASIISNAVVKIKELESLVSELQNFKISVISSQQAPLPNVKFEPSDNRKHNNSNNNISNSNVGILPLSTTANNIEENSCNLSRPLIESLLSDYPSIANNDFQSTYHSSKENHHRSLASYSPSASPLLANYPTVCISSTGMLLDANLAFLSLFQLTHPSFPSIPPYYSAVPRRTAIGFFPPAAKALHMNTFYTITHPQYVSNAHASLQHLLSAVQQNASTTLLRWKQTCITSAGVLLDVEITLTPVYHNNRFRFCTAFFVPIEQESMCQFTSPQSFGQRSLSSTSTPSPSSSSSNPTELYYDY